MTELSGWIVTVDRVAVAGQRLVDGVVDDLVDEVVQAARTGRADVHAGPLANRLETLQDGDVLGVITRLLAARCCGRLVATVPFVYTSDAPASRTNSSTAGAGPYVVIILAGGPLGTAARSVTKVLQNSRKCPRLSGPLTVAIALATRNRRTAGLPSAVLRRSTTSSDIRSSSCAHTASGHATITSPSRSRNGVRVRRERRAGRIRPRALDLGQQRRGREPAVSASSAWPTGRGPRRLIRPAARVPSAACSTRALGDRDALDAGSSAPGTWPSSVAVTTLWPPRAQHLDQARAASRRRARSSRRRAAAAAGRRARRPAPRARPAAARAAPSRCWPREP